MGNIVLDLGKRWLYSVTVLMHSRYFERRAQPTYYFDKLKEELGTITSVIGKLTTSEWAPAATTRHALWLHEQLAPEIAVLERLQKICESLGIDEDNLADLELLTDNSRYRSEFRDLRVAIAHAAGEVRNDTRDREQQEALDTLLANGFTVDDDTDALVRGNQRVVIEAKHRDKDWWYEFTLTTDGGLVALTGKSGEFANLLEAVGVNAQAEVKR